MLPSTRELELETLLRSRDVHISNLTDQIAVLRTTAAPTPSSSAAAAAQLKGTTVARESSTVTTALIHKITLLQDENTSLYNILHASDTAKWKEENQVLVGLVSKLQDALTQSHTVIKALSGELSKMQEDVIAKLPSNRMEVEETHRHSRRSLSPPTRQRSTSPRPRARTPRRTSVSPSSATTATNSRIPPTGPRAFKKPRVEEGGGGRRDNRRSRGDDNSSGGGARTRGGGEDRNKREYSRSSSGRPPPPRASSGTRAPISSSSSRGHEPSNTSSSRPSRGHERGGSGRAPRTPPPLSNPNPTPASSSQYDRSLAERMGL